MARRKEEGSVRGIETVNTLVDRITALEVGKRRGPFAELKLAATSSKNGTGFFVGKRRGPFAELKLSNLVQISLVSSGPGAARKFVLDLHGMLGTSGKQR